MWEASDEALKITTQPRPAYSVCWRFVNFDDIFLGLFDGDSASVLASAPTRVAESSKATTSSNKMWQSFLFSKQQWTVYKLESTFEMLQTYSLVQWKPNQKSLAMHKLVQA